ncbi:MAG: hypothetical protein IPP52_16625 [Ignavibacteria bacterium]|nr:hypothetical protein [Ignavibacteria bacterium]
MSLVTSTAFVSMSTPNILLVRILFFSAVVRFPSGVRTISSLVFFPDLYIIFDLAVLENKIFMIV